MARPPDWRRYRDRLSRIPELRLNYDPELLLDETTREGWHVDEYEVDLPPEPPGDPLPASAPGASWATACRLVRDYRFPDPQLITGVFEPDGELDGRPMLLRARFLVFRFWFPVRVAEVVDDTRETDGGAARVWGYSYTTLEGHFEKGQIWFTVWKWRRTGRVAFRIRAVSQPDRIRNPFYRIGFKLFGRRLQRRFALTALERMVALTRSELDARVPEPDESASPEVRALREAPPEARDTLDGGA